MALFSLALRFSRINFVVFSMLLILSGLSGLTNIYGTPSEPKIVDPNLKVEKFAEGLEFPTTMAFLGPNDILALEKNSGKVRRIVNGSLLSEPLIDLNVANAWERGLLGIAVTDISNENGINNYSNNHIEIEQEYYDSTNNIKYVFLYFTKRGLASGDEGDLCPRPNMCVNDERVSGNGASNYLYRYEFADDELINPRLLLKTPASPGADHNGGVVLVGPDSHVYVAIGDGDSCVEGKCYENFENSVLNSMRSNFINGTAPDGRGGILRITQDGKTVLAENGTKPELQKGILVEEEVGILGDRHPLNKYYAYGIRNSFGMDFDPVTGRLWDTENGAGFGDEINLVEPGFNSGWAKEQGTWRVSDYTATPLSKGFSYSYSNNTADGAPEQNSLVDFNGKGRYSAPEFIWQTTVAPTALKFYDSDKLGTQYENDMFVADFLNGNVYHFDLNQNRTALNLNGLLEDRIANNTKELDDVIFSLGNEDGVDLRSGITDMEVGPYDGYLYLVSHTKGELYRITPTAKN